MKVQELLISKDKWTQKGPTIDKDGNFMRTINECYPLESWDIINREDVLIFNDTYSYEEVMKIVRRIDI